MPRWLRQCGRAVIALALGVLVGLSASEPEILLAVAAIILLVFVTASLRRPDPLVFIAFVLLPMPKLHVPASPLPIGESIMLLAVLSAFLTLKEGLFPLPRWARLSLGIVVATLVVSTLVNGLFDYQTTKRLLHVAVYTLTIIGLVRGLLPRRMAVRGLQVGLAISVASGMLLPQRGYVGRLTGFFGDPNVAGLMIVSLGTVALTGFQRARYRVVFGLFLLTGLAMTYSRTAILAALMVFLWFWIGRKLKPIPAVGVVVLAAVVIAVLPTSLQSIGPFSDRTGSDQLRDRVATQEVGLVKQSPIIGHGPGTATVMVNFGANKFFFHNSYLALIQEGGVITLGFVMVLLLGTFLALMSLDTTDRQLLLESSIIGVWVMGINLGEVFLDLSAAVVIGFSLAYLVRVRARDAVDRTPTVARAA